MSPQTKLCAHCLNEKPLVEFTFDQKNARYSSWCKKCHMARWTRRRKELREENDPKTVFYRKAFDSNHHAGSKVLKWQDLEEKYIEQLAKCIACEVQLKRNECYVGHLQLLRYGGEHKLENIALFCEDCHKHHRHGSYEAFLTDFIRAKNLRIERG